MPESPFAPHAFSRLDPMRSVSESDTSDLVRSLRALLIHLSADIQRVLSRHGLTFPPPEDEPAFRQWLSAPLAIDWSDASVADLSRETVRALEPGDPGRSLLYHVLALPDGTTSGDGVSLELLDWVENMMWSLKPPPDDRASLDVAVLAYQYRPARRTGHQQHADMVYSRLGIARNGDEPARYDSAARSFVPHAEQGTAHVRAMPARYGVFLVQRVRGAGGLALVEGEQSGDDRREFLVPVRKLFNGTECIEHFNIGLDYGHRHVGEKLRRAVKALLPLRMLPRGPLHQPPFVLRCEFPAPASEAAPSSTWVRFESVGASRLVVPQPQALVSAVDEPLAGWHGFHVGRQLTIAIANRRYTTLRLFSDPWRLFLAGIDELRKSYFPHFAPNWLRYPEPRNVPEFVNIRHTRHKDGHWTDMRQEPADRDAFLKRVAAGDYHARAFTDHCAEGVVSVRVTGWKAHRVLPAFSIIAAPDFFPYADQAELQRWFDDAHVDPKTQFRNGSPLSLSAQRLTASPHHRDPLHRTRAFRRRDKTLALAFSIAARGQASPGTATNTNTNTPPRMISFLSDASSSVFAPGWDITYGGIPGLTFLSTYGLGSPFPEDVKLCAASNSFWPAVSPDASRTFNREDAPTAIPMLDEELGLHRAHPLVERLSLQSAPGWDGEYGPYLTPDGQVDFADISRSDYVANALDGLMLYGAFEHVDSAELVRRIRAYRNALALTDPGHDPAHTTLWLISARTRRVVPPVPDHAHTASDDDRIYRFLWVRGAAPVKQGIQHVPGRLRVPYAQAIRCDANALGWTGNLQSAAPGAAALDLYHTP